MRTCSNCGATVREGAKFCTSCGTRLNDTDGASQEDTWSGPANDDSTSTPTTGETGAPVEGDVAATAADASTSGQEGFSWSWSSSANETDATNEARSPQIDEESGTVLDEADPTGVEAPAIADATEVEILEDEPNASEEELAVEAEPTATEGELAAEAETTESGAVPAPASADDSDATLAAWAGQWSDDERAEATPLRSDTGIDEVEPGEITVTAVQDDDEEATVEKAERLLGELRRIIPALARPRPTDPNAQAEGNTVLVGGGQSLPELLDDLDDARSSEQFDDLRAVIESARQNPRDVDTMLGLASQTDRLLALVDDRDRMASKLEALSVRLRGAATGDEGDHETNGDAEDERDPRKIL
jgi:hypothetical protein